MLNVSVFKMGINEGVMKDGICTCVASVSWVCCRRRTSNGERWKEPGVKTKNIYSVFGVVAYKRGWVGDTDVRGGKCWVEGQMTTAKRQSSKATVATDNKREGRRVNTRITILLSLNLLWGKGEGDDRIIIPLPLPVQKPSQPLHLRGEIHDDDLHLDVQMELENLRAGLEGLYPRADEHVSFEAELLERIDHLAEFRTPGQHSKLQEMQDQKRSR